MVANFFEGRKQMDGKDTLMNALLEANKRLSIVVIEQKRLSGKLFGLGPQETGNESNPEISVASLTQRLTRSIGELEAELGRQHTGLGELASPVSQQVRAVNY
jgi:hypothetical protein